MQPKELPIDLDCALKSLDKLTSEVSYNTTRLLNHAVPNWRNKRNLNINIPDIKMTSLSLKNNLHEFIEFSKGCLGNAVNAPDKGIQL